MTYTAVYLEDDAGRYELILVSTSLFTEREGYAPAFLDLVSRLADGDLWAVRLIESSTLDFDQILEE